MGKDREKGGGGWGGNEEREVGRQESIVYIQFMVHEGRLIMIAIITWRLSNKSR